MIRIVALVGAWLCLASAVQGQAPGDTLPRMALSEVVVSATRSERVAAEQPLPVSVVTRTQIEQMGAQRLAQVLQEQTGLALVADHGTGLQVQGFSADYTLILIDGEPLIGRTAGTLDLTRIAVGSIERIEILKGPSSSLYGSEALGGVINIITRKPLKGWAAEARLRGGSQATYNGSLLLSGAKPRISGSLFYDRYQTNGYTVPGAGSPTVAPSVNHTVQGKAGLKLAARHTVDLSARLNLQQARTAYSSEAGQPLHDLSSVADQNLTLQHSYEATGVKLRSRIYASQYRAESTIRIDSTNRVFDATRFNQTFLRPELQGEWALGAAAQLVSGVGYILESVEATRYDERKSFSTLYAFAQAEWRPWPALNLLVGARADRQSVYGSQLSPKLAASYRFGRRLTLQASAGRGFKAPDFRTLYLDFNNAVAGYSVYGTQVLPNRLAALRSLGQLDEAYTPPNSTGGSLKAERSWNITGGFTLSPTDNASLSLSAFHNEVTDLIETQTIARRTNGATIYSYYNIGHIYTQGLEAELKYKPYPWAELVGGYQYLQTGDRAVEAALKAGQYFYRDPATYDTRRIRLAEYGGLFNRSRHMLNVRLFARHQASGFAGSVRALYRSRFGFADLNGNGILDDAGGGSEYVHGYLTLNTSLQKTLLQKRLELQAGIDNLLNYRDPQGRIPTLPGRQWWLAVSYRLSSKPKTDTGS